MDRAAVRETQHSNHATQMCSFGYDVYPANGTHDATSQLSSPVSSQRLGHSECDAPSQLFTPDSQSHILRGGDPAVTESHMG